MDFSLSEEQILLRDSVEKYVADHCDVARHRALCAAGKGFDPAVWQQFAELGWLSVPFAQEYGGFDGGAAGVMVVAQALGGGLVREPFLHTVVTCGGLLQAAGDSRHLAQHIPSIVDGSRQWAFAFAENNASYELDAVTTVAVKQGDDYSISGEKIAVLNGDAADQLIVSAQTDAGVSLFVVGTEATAVSREPFVAVDGSGGAVVQFTGAHGELLGEAGAGVAVMQTAIDNAIVAIGAESLGAMQSLLDETVSYTKTREQFGQPIGKFQALQHAMADMYMKVEETRSLLLNAVIQLDEHSDEAPAACAALKVKVAEAGRIVAQQSVQLHGGIGMTDELSVGHHYKRLLLLGKLFGDEDFYLNRFTDLDAA